MEDPFESERLRLEKTQEIRLALQARDVAALRHLSVTKLGLVSDELRVEAWPLLLGVDPATYMPKWRSLPRLAHRDSHQISLDCQRSLFNYDILAGLSARIRERKVAELELVLNMVLQTLPDFYYNQGFHDICTVLLLACGEDLAFKLAHCLAQSHYRECMRQNFDGVVQQMGLIYPLLQQCDPELEEKLRDISPQPAVAIPFIITGFQHDITSYETATRVFDFFVALHPAAPIYMSAMLLHSQRAALLACEDMAELHMHMKAALDDTDFDSLCAQTWRTMSQLPPSVLASLAEDAQGFPEDSPMQKPDVNADAPAARLSRLTQTLSLVAPVAAVLAYLAAEVA